MKQGRTDRDWAVVALMTFCAGAVVAWALTSPPPAWPKLTVEQWAAWVQAIGSVVALGIAIVVPLNLHAREQRAQRQRAAEDRIERQHLARIHAKAAASSVLPVARTFLGGLQSAMSQMTDADIEEYNDVEDADLMQKLDQLRTCSPHLANMGGVGEMALDAIASAELFLRSLADWQFYERYTNNGVIEDPERGYYDVFDRPPELLPILRTSIDRTNAFLERADAMFK